MPRRSPASYDSPEIFQDGFGLSPYLHPAIAVAAVLTLLPFLAAAFFSARFAAWTQSLPAWLTFASPAVLAIPYALVTIAAGNFAWDWFALYALLPVLIAAVLRAARQLDVAQRGHWLDFTTLAILGFAVDLRWFEPAWPPHLSVFNKMLLLDAGVYAFVAMRRLDGVGFDLRLKLHDAGIGLRELAFYAPIAAPLGVALGFLHRHAGWPGLGSIAEAWIFTFFFIAVPEELFFRGWLQNLLERRIGRIWALVVTAVLFGLSHFNKRAAHFNWRYVLLAALAGLFYGRAWRAQRRVGASAITHATVDAIWSLWLR